MGFCIGMRNWYALLNGKCYQFESKRTRDRFVENGATKITSQEAYTYYGRIKIEDYKVPIGRKDYVRS